MTPSLKQFMAVSIGGMTLVLAALFYFHVDISRAYLLDHLSTHNRSMALILRNSLMAGGMGEALATSPDRFSKAVIGSLNTTLEEELESGPIVKVKVYSTKSRILYSTKPSEIGLDASHNGGVLTALLGVPVSDLVEREKLNTLDGSREMLDLHQQYIPIEHPDTGEVQGVFEIYSDVSQLIEEANRSQWTVFWSMSGILLAFYLGIIVAFIRTHRALEYERRQREAHLNELMQIRSDLEDRVKERTAELDKSKEFLKSVIDGIGSPLQVIRPDRSVMLMNSAARRQVPKGRHAAEHPSCYELSHGLDTPCGPPDHPCSFDDVMKYGRPARVRHTHYDDDGEPLIIDLQFTPLIGEGGELEGVIEVEHDVTQLVRMQAGLVESEARLQAIMDNVPDAILTCDAQCVIQSLNPAALKMFGGGGADLIGEELTRFFVDSAACCQLQPGTALRNEIMLRRVDGSEFPADVWLGPLELTDETSYIAVVRDISGRIKAQQELDTTRQQYFQQEKMAALGQLAAGILHEVGNPIAAIAGAASELQGVSVCGSRPSNDCPFDDAVSRNIELIDEQTMRLARITREIADFASPRPRERELLDLNSLLQSTTRLLSYDRRFRGVDMRLDLDTSLPAIVGVADQLTQVFMNLIINAVDACTVAGPGRERVSVISALEGDKVRVTIKDSGCGMTRETLDHAMEPFFTTKPVGKGTGLGLSLCDTIARSHGGLLDIDSELGVGTSVHVLLPIELSEEPSLKHGTTH